MNRRQFLASLGLGGGAAALSIPRFAKANGVPPKRLIILSSGHGIAHEHWAIRPEGYSDAAPWSLDLTAMTESEMSPSLAPLHGVRRHLNVLDGLSMATAELDISGYRHEKGWIHAWCGSWVYFTGSDLFSTTPSLDQLVAAAIARPDRLPSLELTIEDGRPIAHGGKGLQLPATGSPEAVWDRLFGLSADTGSRSRVLDFARAEGDSLLGRLGAADRGRLESHTDMLRQLEQRFEGLATADCAAVDRESLSSASYDDTFDAMCELVAAAFACDLTRVATLSLGDLPSRDFGWGDYLSGDAHNDFAHRLYVDPLASQAMGDYVAHHARQFARLVELLASIEEPDGSTLLDNTLVVWGNELGDGWHGYMRYGMVTAGGGWAWETGRVLHEPYGVTPIAMVTPDGAEPVCGTPHQHALVSIARAMGLSVDHIGLTDVRNKAGQYIDLTGGLPGLL